MANEPANTDSSVLYINKIRIPNNNIYSLMDEEARNSLNNKENISNKITTISSSGTNSQYPSAKAVYDALPVMEVL